MLCIELLAGDVGVCTHASSPVDKLAELVRSPAGSCNVPCSQEALQSTDMRSSKHKGKGAADDEPASVKSLC